MNNKIGLDALGFRLPNNDPAGIRVEGMGTGNRISQNQIAANHGLGIDLGADGLTLNDDVLDVDSGANRLQNFPVIDRVLNDTLEYYINTSPGTFEIEFLTNPECDPTGHGEGWTYLMTRSVTTNGDGFATETLNGLELLPLQFVTATATGHFDGNTSEFSQCKQNTQGLSTPPVTSPTPQHTTGPVAGDVTGDSQVDEADVLALMTCLADNSCNPGFDTDCDGDVDMDDFLAVMVFIAGLPPLPQNEPCPDIGSDTT